MSSKDEIRKRIWDYMEEHNIARFPRPVHGRIPNFEGAEKAADRLSRTESWRGAKVLKCNPDSAQQPVREKALREGKALYMAVPRLREKKCFVEVKPGASDPRQASTIKGAFQFGRSVGVDQMMKVDLVIAGCVAVNRVGTRLGKGGGFSDLEYGLAREFGIVDDSTHVATTVHPCQIIDEPIPRLPHDEVLDLIATPRECLSSTERLPRPLGIYWELLPSEKVESIPVLKLLRDNPTHP